jgi:hypothetical protein
MDLIAALDLLLQLEVATVVRPPSVTYQIRMVALVDLVAAPVLRTGMALVEPVHRVRVTTVAAKLITETMGQVAAQVLRVDQTVEELAATG